MDPSAAIDSRAQVHAPKTAAEIERAARDLAAQGHSVHTISHILRLHVEVVRGMLGPDGDVS